MATKKPNNTHPRIRCKDIPFISPSILTVFVGLLVTAGGGGLCVVGYYADYFSTETVNAANGTVTYRTNDVSRSWLVAMPYVGSVIMGIGSFLIIVACVVVCEAWDRVKNSKIESSTSAKKSPKDIFYSTVVEEVARDTKTRQDRLSATLRGENDLQNRPLTAIKEAALETSQEEKPSFLERIGLRRKEKNAEKPIENSETISKALKQIPMELFTLTPFEHRCKSNSGLSEEGRSMSSWSLPDDINKNKKAGSANSQADLFEYCKECSSNSSETTSPNLSKRPPGFNTRLIPPQGVGSLYCDTASKPTTPDLSHNVHRPGGVIKVKEKCVDPLEDDSQHYPKSDVCVIVHEVSVHNEDDTQVENFFSLTASNTPDEANTSPGDHLASSV
ncbi:uncharacterized protein LOC106173869 [Lingula anatina]|uniref:Uncharacterized protein LOC106173869 n=1 Tax=Lingula anatina TaxID=7574 RepID=A0A1S3JJM9_LINAN|nr:uncharacterized protein LOC106173869 [Lingula anatina]XP_013410618.1 uncharacterized protein LOC106173869 [Lingula anatina]XP_013410619.1 uncharacterized protein LOC106173869 [Lingula anatina]XP_013410620.1 uncharacterized protein LOC106173869 [Lingula anatina]XP_013410621.1 uncharacterized protein LOC106173869 [Lingula anatina]XP_013410622.1 uncharacterized protein LOC106173869 [Lingula anatina]|eukprot:XP_013410617.1 uncharacterized protein LOC106173869 [Lingula anatina]